MKITSQLTSFTLPFMECMHYELVIKVWARQSIDFWKSIIVIDFCVQKYIGCFFSKKSQTNSNKSWIVKWPKLVVSKGSGCLLKKQKVGIRMNKKVKRWIMMKKWLKELLKFIYNWLFNENIVTRSACFSACFSNFYNTLGKLKCV